jgi:hypothetical protein
MSHPKAPVPHVASRPAPPPRTRLGRLLERLALLVVAPVMLIGFVATVMASMAGPGVTVTTSTRPSTSSRLTTRSGTYFVAGLTERGPVDRVVEIRSIADYERRLGRRVTYGTLHDDLTTFFAEGGQRAYVARVVGAGAAAATVTLTGTDGAATVNVLDVTAVDPGGWGNDIAIEVRAGDDAGTFTLVVTYETTTETFRNLADAAAAAAALANSTLVRGTDLGATVDPDIQGPTALAGGTDDRATVVAADYVAALNERASADLGDGAVAIPGQTAGTVGAGLLVHAKNTRRIALLAVAADASATDATNAAGALIGTDGSEHGGVFWPHVVVPDGAGDTRTISPEGFVAGRRAQAHETVGAWQAPAGVIHGRARHAVSIAADVDGETGSTLDDGHVSAIRLLASGDGPKRPTLYGWRSLSDDETNFFHLKSRDLINRIAVGGKDLLEQYVFRTIDGRGQLTAEAKGALIGFIEPVRAAGGIYERVEDGELIDPGYTVDTGPGINPPEVVASGTIKARLAVRPSPTAQLIEFDIVQVGVADAL